MACNEVGGLLNGVGAADGKEVQHLEIAVEHMRGSTQSRLHHAARRTEYRAAACGYGEGIIELLVGQFGELDARCLDHAREFARGDCGIDFALHLLAVALILLGRAGNDGYGEQIFGPYVVFFAPIGLEEGAEHLLWGLAGGEVGYHFGILLLYKLDPRGTAGGEHGHGLARLDSVYELGGLLHYRQVGGDVHIEHLALTQTADCGHHFALDIGAYGHIEGLAQRRADGGRREEHYLLCGVGEGLPHLVYGRALGQGADGAGNYALAATDADRLGKGHIESRANVHVEAAADGAYGVDVLLAAGRHTAHTVDALVVVAHDVGRGVVYGQNKVLALESVLIHAVA